MAKATATWASLLVLLLFVSGCVIVPPGFGYDLDEVLVEESDRWFEPHKIALVDVGGFISTEAPSWLTGGTSVADVKERLKRAREDGRVKAVVLRIDSPGGSATASDMIYQEILKFREASEKPVVAAFMDVAASGGYYIGCAADEIVATPTSITGSVGVLMRFYNFEGLQQMVGIRAEVIKSGAMKDIASPHRGMTAEEREVLMGLNTTMYEQFKRVVREARPRMEEEDFAFLADGRPVSADEALEHDMIDRIGYLSDAIASAKKRADIGDAHVVLYRAGRSPNRNIYAESALGMEGLRELLEVALGRSGPGAYYLWMPGQ
jgi:protease-4